MITPCALDAWERALQFVMTLQIVGCVHHLRLRHEDVVDGDVHELDEEADETHDEEADLHVRRKRIVCAFFLVSLSSLLSQKATSARKNIRRAATEVAHAMRVNSLRSGLVHFFTRCTESLMNCFKGCTITAFTSDMISSSHCDARALVGLEISFERIQTARDKNRYSPARLSNV